jgi:hypothetical protein
MDKTNEAVPGRPAGTTRSKSLVFWSIGVWGQLQPVYVITQSCFELLYPTHYPANTVYSRCTDCEEFGHQPFISCDM